MSFSSDAWAAARPWYDAILAHPFLTGLADGTLEQKVFLRYIADDTHYLSRYARALATTAARWPEPAQAAVLARFSAGAVDAERLLHEALLADAGLSLADVAVVEPTPTCLAYVSTLQADAALAPAGVALAGLLPCFRIYTEVGRELVTVLSGDAAHPYAAWLRTYGDPAFAADTARAESFADEQAERHPGTVAAMHDAYARAARFEWMFWDAAWRGETWPEPGSDGGSSTDQA